MHTDCLHVHSCFCESSYNYNIEILSSDRFREAVRVPLFLPSQETKVECSYVRM